MNDYEVVVIGGGQAGLAVGHYLAEQGRRFVIFEAADGPAAAWRSRWDSLRLFTPARHDSLPGKPFPGDPDRYPTVRQLHSSEYRNPSQIGDGPVLVVGGGNTGYQIAEELAATQEVHLAVGSRQAPLPQRLFGRDVFDVLTAVGAMRKTVDSRIGRRLKDRDTLIGSSPRRARRLGIRLHSRATVARVATITFADGTALQPATVIWATGFGTDHSWIDAPVFDADRRLVHERGVTGSRGLYFLGLPWQHTRGSALLGWVKDDARHIADAIARAHLRVVPDRSDRLRAATPADEPFLTRMLGHAANWREGTSNPVELHYVEGYGRPGDVGVIAQVAGEPAGAAWCRLLTGSDRGYGYVADDVPELAIAVEPAHRGRGLATALVEALQSAAAEAGYRAVSLSVEPDNPSRRIYERAGFVRCGTEGGSWTMIADL